MRLAERTDYALRVLMYLAATGDLATVGTMATQFGVSHHHLVKVVQMLSEMGLVTTTRGRHGGVRLARAPKDIRIGEVVQKMEPDFALAECMRPDGDCPIHNPCRLANLLRGAEKSFLDTLNESTLHDLIMPKQTLLRAFDLFQKKKTTTTGQVQKN